MKRIAVWSVMALIAILVFLVIASQLSTAHKAAMQYLHQQEELRQALGPNPTFVLIGLQQQMRAGGAGCTRLTYLMLGERQNKLVRAKMSIQGDHEKWELDQYLVGSAGKLDTRCDYRGK